VDALRGRSRLARSEHRAPGLPPLLAAAGFQRPCAHVGGRGKPRSCSRRRRGSRNASGLRTQSEPLQRGSIELAASVQAMRRLEPAHGGSGIVVPFAARGTCKRTVPGQGRLNFADTIGGRSFLARLLSSSLGGCRFRGTPFCRTRVLARRIR
jgi:hypothetical protein